ncbi:MAG: aconitase X catalytic domain-containing protein [Candidatus Asgardarchaeia archaeon]
MYLSKEEEKMLEGEYGYPLEIAMKIVVSLGDIYGAESLIPIKKGHVSGVSYKTMGDAPLDFLKSLSKSGVKVRVPTTLNPIGFDLGRWKGMGIPSEFYKKQMEIVECYSRLGIDPTLTCTPYYLTDIKPGEDLAFAESSAVVYVNSVIKAKTNRLGGPAALASSIVGKVPKYGYHIDDNRKGEVLIKVKADLRDYSDFGVLGIFIGSVVRDKVPVISGIENSNEDELKQLSAGLGASGMTALFLKESEAVWKSGKPEERIEFDEEELRETYEKLSRTNEKPELVFFGCPHLSLKEIKELRKKMEGRRVKDGIEVWACTSKYVKNLAREDVEFLEKKGIKLFTDTCVVVTWLEKMGYNNVMTNAAKSAYYIPHFCKSLPMIERTDRIIDKISTPE